MNAKIFGDRVRDARRRRGLTQAQLAKRASVGADTIGRIEGARYSPRLDTMLRLADALGLPLDLLLRERFDDADELAALIRALPERDRRMASVLVGAMYGELLTQRPSSVDAES